MRLRIVGDARPVGSADRIPHVDRAERAVDAAEHGRVVHPGRHSVAPDILERLRPQFRREVDQIVGNLERVARVRRRLRRERLRRARLFPGHVGLRHGTLFDRPHGLTGHAVEDVEKGLLARDSDGFDRAPVDRDVGQNRRGRHVVVPERMMHQLEMPLPLSCSQIDANEALGKQVVPGAVAAVVIRGGRLHRQVDQAQILIDRDLRPHAGVAVDRPRISLPRVVAELTGQRDGVERPQQLSGAHIERAHKAFRVVVGADGCPFAERGADDHDVLYHRRRRVQTDLAGLQIDLLAGAEHGALFQIEHTVAAERVDQATGSRVERHETVAGRDIENTVVSAPVSPVREPAPRQLTRRNTGAPSLTHAVRPHQLAGFSVERDDGASGAAGGIQHAVDGERRSLQLVLRTRSEAVGLEAPRHFERAEVGGVDLIER